MYWFISAFLVASAIFFLAPEKISLEANNAKIKRHLPVSLLILPLIVLGWLVIDAVANGTNYATVAAFGFVTTACLIALPKLHKFIMPSALLTAVALIVMVFMRMN
ncbi:MULTISPECIES: hypothetical protein [Shewanella]|jgi:hypothetical protein|uniref:DUF3325 domain-containing protein n=1 Tax=Shewanella baltica (strain OS155 / ATCC BAA-1091) TaxID=325240 RepID=A3D6Y6_SHEB5|nr:MULTISPECIES: hypothetical protein [Shewanella]MBO6199315.1 hypothetical protein [Psychrobacter sp.]ABN62499.1 conserved hypothetical protein [Shewanella baltica OS155]AEG10605.1 hypothetical protein Sbal175_1328 [Shewanella baltica BA175]AEH14843.1 hypothetical protein Sbal117_3157 [Shewanella baltica OS117]AVT46474.1 hypothetical protein C8I07_01335 [Shewanella baltica]